LEVPAENVGRAITDIQNMSGTFTGPETFGDTAVLTGTAPAASLAEYGSVLTGYTRGKGKLSCTFSGYSPCHNAEEVIAAAGYDPDADLVNPCDSVFCAHGAGFNVRWNEVKSRMHLSAALSTRQAVPVIETLGGPKEKKRSARPDIFAADKELIAIFEQTYGPIKSRADPFELRRHDAPVKKEKPPKPIGITYAGTAYVLVDGYNVIYSWDELRTAAAESMADARDALIRLMGNYRGFRGCELILVFDAYRVPHSTREIETVSGVSVVYTKEAETADTYIEITAHELAKNHRVRVVTGDGMEQLIILGDGALRVSPEAFHAEIEDQQKEMREYLS
jgi:predicted RNA-binding protein with PIN domain